MRVHVDLLVVSEDENGGAKEENLNIFIAQAHSPRPAAVFAKVDRKCSELKVYNTTQSPSS